jgi:thiamine pyrophosphate-dependent acetolactate synthase large subunit-like protein
MTADTTNPSRGSNGTWRSEVIVDLAKHYGFRYVALNPGAGASCTGTQIGVSPGAALANKGTNRLVVDFQPDGDLMDDVGALWIAARYRIPLPVVIYNNRASYNDWNHQLVMARIRGTDMGRAHIGMDLSGAAPDFAGLARAIGWWAAGPIENADDLELALARAIALVKNSKPALVEAVTQHR